MPDAQADLNMGFSNLRFKYGYRYRMSHKPKRISYLKVNLKKGKYGTLV
jgi:hypothetical protein